uniref:Uncharacterized protein n=1 Tax=Cacopsylla melanoneura TaxID=428564 RepID=A0A8D8R1Q2_9HEMI
MQENKIKKISNTSKVPTSFEPAINKPLSDVLNYFGYSCAIWNFEKTAIEGFVYNMLQEQTGNRIQFHIMCPLVKISDTPTVFILLKKRNLDNKIYWVQNLRFLVTFTLIKIDKTDSNYLFIV